MMRLTNANGILEPGQLRAIAEVARDYASRPVSNPRVRRQLDRSDDPPVRPAPLDQTRRRPGDLGLRIGRRDHPSGGDTMLNISGSPVAPARTPTGDRHAPAARTVQEEIRGDDDLCNMPRKFNISISGTPEGGAQDAINDIGLEPAKKRSTAGRRSASTCASAAARRARAPRRPPAGRVRDPGRGVRRRPQVRRIVPRPRRPAGPREEPLALLRRRSRHRWIRDLLDEGTSTPICGPPARTSATSTHVQRR